MSDPASQLTGEQRRRLYTALQAAFPQVGALKRLVQFRLGENPESVAAGDSLPDRVAALITWAESHGRVRELLAEALEENADHPDLRRLRDEVLGPVTPTPKYRVLVVDQMHRGDFATIKQALIAAQPGDKIQIRPGLYEEALVIDKPLEIEGEGRREEIVIQIGSEPVILFEASRGQIRNLTLRQTRPSLAENWPCVEIGQGRVELESCDISGNTAVRVNNGSHPTLRGNTIHHAKVGVTISTGGYCVLEDNDIVENYYGVYINHGSRPTIRRNRIVENESVAIRVRSGGGGVFENNDVQRNGKGAWDIDPDCLPNLTRTGNLE